MPIHYDAIEDGQTKHPTVYSLIIHSWPVTYVYLAGLCRWELGTDSNLVSSVSFSDGVDAEFTGQLWNTPWTPNSFTAAPAPHMHVVFDRPVTVSSVQTQGDVDGNMVSKFMISYLMSRDADFEDLSYEDGYPVSCFFLLFFGLLQFIRLTFTILLLILILITIQSFVVTSFTLFNQSIP